MLQKSVDKVFTDFEFIISIKKYKKYLHKGESYFQYHFWIITIFEWYSLIMMLVTTINFSYYYLVIHIMANLNVCTFLEWIEFSCQVENNLSVVLCDTLEKISYWIMNWIMRCEVILVFNNPLDGNKFT
jgi:hypothetical protein